MNLFTSIASKGKKNPHLRVCDDQDVMCWYFIRKDSVSQVSLYDDFLNIPLGVGFSNHILEGLRIKKGRDTYK